MKKLKFHKLKLVGVFSSALYLAAPTVDAEAVAFNFTAPSQILVQVSFRYAENKFRPTEAESQFIALAIPQTRKRP